VSFTAHYVTVCFKIIVWHW